MSTYRKFAGIVIGVVALATTAGTAIVFAQSVDTQAQIQQVAERFQRGGERGGLRGIIDKEAMHIVVADALGITVDELEAYNEDGMRLPEIAEALDVDIESVKAALDAAKTDAINQAVADGAITQEQADQILSGEGRPDRGGREGGLREIIDREAMHAVVADALGITVDELEAYHDDGMRLPEIAEELGVDIENVKAALDVAKTDAINQAVEDGTITQEQADQILSGEGRPGRDGQDGRRGGGRSGRGPASGDGPADVQQDA